MAKAKESSPETMYHHGMCGKCHAGKLLLLGALVLINSIWSIVSWPVFIGGLLIVAGIVKLVKPMCPHCA